MEKIDELLSRRVEKILPSKEGLRQLIEKKKIRLYQGFDPSKPNLHIGHLGGLLQLKAFQDLGHEVIFLIGDFTGMVGDPTDKTAARPKLTKTAVLENAKTYKQQAGKILNFTGPNPVKMRFNSDWLAKLTLAEIIELTSNFTVQQFLERDMFQERLKKNRPIFLHEFLYPLLVTYDAIAMEVDLEIGGSDQLFNMSIGRPLIKSLKHIDKFVLTTKILADKAGNKIGKTAGNAINLFGDTNNLYGQIMALPDDVIIDALTLITELPLEEVKSLDTKAKSEPMQVKKRLAFEVVKLCHGDAVAKQAQTYFETTVQQQQAPEKVPTFKLASLPQNSTLIDLLEKSKLVQSRGEAKRLIAQRGVEINKLPATDYQLLITELKPGDILKVGKRRWLKLV